MTTDLKTFLIISGFIYSTLGMFAFCLQLAIVVNSFSKYYHGFWIDVFLIVGGSVMMIAAISIILSIDSSDTNICVNIGFCTAGLVFSIINYVITTRCVSLSSLDCDENLASNLKVILLVVFILALIHTIMNMIYISKEHHRTLSKSNSNVADH